MEIKFYYNVPYSSCDFLLLMLPLESTQGHRLGGRSQTGLADGHRHGLSHEL